MDKRFHVRFMYVLFITAMVLALAALAAWQFLPDADPFVVLVLFVMAAVSLGGMLYRLDYICEMEKTEREDDDPDSDESSGSG
jgi:uncharacterized membrane protein